MKGISKGMGVGCLLLTAVMTGQSYDGPECKYDTEKTGRMEKMEEKRERRRQKRIERLTKELNLSEEQQKQISGIFKEGKSKIKAERKTFRKKIQQIRKDTDKQIEKLLNAGQLKKWKEYKKKIREKRKDRRGGRRKHFKEDAE